MKIQYDWKTFTFSGITMKEFRAIREFMKLAKLTSENHRFRISDCNTADTELTELGKKISDQIRDVEITCL